MKNVEVMIEGSNDKIFCNSNIDLVKGDQVIVSINNILYNGYVVLEADIDNSNSNNVVRKVNIKDINIIEKNRKDCINALEEVKKISKKLNLFMSFVDCYYTFDRKQLYFTFVADNRVDFRELAKRLAEKYKTRIELRQIGIRDKAKKIGGLGPCGLFLCCNKFLNDFNSVSINMAKNQFLALNPSKINGLCGRLLCCLKYEDFQYKELKQGAPSIGSYYETEKGKGKVISIDIFKNTCNIELDDKSIIVANYGEKDESTK